MSSKKIGIVLCVLLQRNKFPQAYGLKNTPLVTYSSVGKKSDTV